MSGWEVTGLLGRGGFGRVYLVQRTGPDGWRREVAVKLLDPARTDAAALRRLRDEARILAAVHDRAVVAAEPPVHLAQGWAVVMEYVPGCTLGALLEAGHRPPDTVALELVEEVARALGHLADATGADGHPLGLVHRDLKPANLQLTRAGAVKILDFGIAHARLPDREASTTRAVVGTPGFIAPERLLGQDLPAGDIYALGAVLAAATGAAPAVAEPTLGEPGAGSVPASPPGPVQELIHAMTAWSPADRPSAREVARRARDLRARLEGPALSDWAAGVVPARSVVQHDALSGTLLVEVRPSAPRRAPAWAAASVGALALGVWLGSRGGEPPPIAASPPADQVAPTPTGSPAPVDAAAPPVTPAPTPAPRAPARPPDARREAPTPTPEAPPPATPTPAPAPPPSATVPVRLQGDARTVRALGEAGAVTLPGELTAGTWRLEVTFPDRAPFEAPRPIVVTDRPLTVTCALRFNGCATTSP